MKVPTITREAIAKVTDGSGREDAERLGLQQPEIFSFADRPHLTMTEDQRIAYKAGIAFALRCLEETTLQ